jgi:valyl-tRNA synthetase
MDGLMTTASAPTELPKSYVPGAHEDAIRQRWDESGLFHAEPATPGGGDGPDVFCMLIPPPNVTAPLHLGHAFNNSLQDVLVRFHRMRGDRTLWMPGTDHAGIATQAVVENRLIEQGRHRRDMGREAFVATVQAWKDEYEATITDQLKAIGASCDWARQRFTMDEVCAHAVREAFFRLFRDGLIYRGKRLVNWDPATLTALADDEVEMKEVDGHFWYLRYPLVDDDGNDTGEHVTVATTRPETMLGDSGVGVNPTDPARYALVGRRVRLPIVDRIVPIIADEYVVIPDPESSDPKARYASGFLKVTPAHDQNDWLLGQRHDLAVINVMAPDGTISDEHGWDDCTGDARAFLGMTREDARAAVVDWFRDHGLLEEVKDYRHSVGHSYRSHVPIEPYLSDQWYVRVTDDRLVGEAQRALSAEQREGEPPARAAATDDAGGDGGLSFFPARYARTYEAWHDNLRDWCISRQLWWGHRIPVWRIEGGDRSVLAGLDDCAVQPVADATGATVAWHVCPPPGRDDLDARLDESGERDPDVLDTWFSSALWPLGTMGWPEPERFPDTVGLLETFNPSSVLFTGREIITLWVSRMVMFNRHFRARHLPFRHVYVHAIVQDGYGQKMSKSLGNGVDPRDIIRSHGADSLRYTLAQMATATQDVRLPVDTLCPHCEHAFHPKEQTTAAGHRLARPKQECPHCHRSMISAYGVASGKAEPTDDEPLALNTSSKFDHGRNFANKLWNATRFALANLASDAGAADAALPLDGLGVVDRWIVNRLHRTLHVVEDALADYQFSAYADAMYDLVWRDFCDWYLEAIKPTVRRDPARQQVLRTVINAILRLLHPICPFVSEALWASVQAAGPAGAEGITLPPADLLAGAGWPDIACGVHDDDADQTFERVQTLVNAVRAMRSKHDVPPKRRIVLRVGEATHRLVERAEGVVETLCGLESVERRDADRPGDAIPLPFEGDELLLTGLVDAVDVESERARLAKLIEEKEKAVAGFTGRLANKGYVDNAPPAVVEETRARLAEAEGELATARMTLEALSRE